MGKRILVIIALLISGSPTSRSATAQTIKLHKKTTTTAQGEIARTPYITYAAFETISVSGRARLGELLTVPSLDEAIRILGEPKSIVRNVFPDGERFIATLDFGGMTLKYAKRKDGNVRLTTLEMRSPDWSLKVGGWELRPGMAVDHLSPAVLQSIKGDTFLGEDDVDGVAVIRVAKPGAAGGKNVKIMEGEQTQVSVHVDKSTGTVKVVRFHRIV